MHSALKNLFRQKKIHIDGACGDQPQLVACLSFYDLLFMGIGAVIGAGIFILTGVVAATQAGPAVVLSYLIAGIACVFSALSYAELATSIGGSGSAYGYAYLGFGEIIAWLVGWDLILEYALSVATVSVGWSSYFSDLLKNMNILIAYKYLHGPFEQGWFNMPAVGVVLILTLLLISGAKTSSRFNNVMVLVKLSIILLFIYVAVPEIKVQNWHPFMPFTWTGVLHGASLIFFAYIGFDAVSTAAAEAINPQRDLARSIIGSLMICTLLYMVVAGVLTGIMPYAQLHVASPISYALLHYGYKTVAALIGIGTIAGLSTVMLVMYYGLTRVLIAMTQDGLLPSGTDKESLFRVVIIMCGVVISSVAG